MNFFALVPLVGAAIGEHSEAGGRVTPNSDEHLCASLARRRVALIGAVVSGAVPPVHPAVREAFAGQPASAEYSGEAGDPPGDVVTEKRSVAVRR